MDESYTFLLCATFVLLLGIFVFDSKLCGIILGAIVGGGLILCWVILPFIFISDLVSPIAGIITYIVILAFLYYAYKVKL